MQISQIFCKLPLQGGRDMLHKQNTLFISQSIEGTADISRNHVGFSVRHPGQSSVADNTGEAPIKDY